MKDKMIVIEPCPSDLWYSALETRMVRVLKEDDNFYYTKGGQISKEHASETTEIEVDLDEEIIDFIYAEAAKLKITPDEYANIMLRQAIKKL